MLRVAVVTTTIIGDAELRAVVAESPGWRALGLRAWQRSIELAPVSREEIGQGTHGPARVGGGLRDSMRVRFIGGPDPRIEVGSKLTVGDEDYSLLDIVESGTPPHAIDPKTEGGVLVFPKGGTVVFTRHVEHPGTKKNPFVERAFQQVIHESIGVGALVGI